MGGGDDYLACSVKYVRTFMCIILHVQVQCAMCTYPAPISVYAFLCIEG